MGSNNKYYLVNKIKSIILFFKAKNLKYLKIKETCHWNIFQIEDIRSCNKQGQ